MKCVGFILYILLFIYIYVSEKQLLTDIIKTNI